MKMNLISLRPVRLNYPLKNCAVVLAAALQLAAIAAVPISWTATPTSPTYMPAPVPHGSTVEFSVTLKGFTDPAIGAGADVRLWFQTNGMGSAWFSAPAAFASNVVTATFGPEQDTGADRVNCFFGAPSNVFASAVLRLSHAPGFVPNAITPPVHTLDFAAVEIANAPYYTKSETEAKIVELAPAPGDYESVSNRAMRISMPGDDGHPSGLFIPYFNGRAKESKSAYGLIRNSQSVYPGQLELKTRSVEGDGGAVYGVWWPSFIDARNNWLWVASEDYVIVAITNNVNAATNGLFRVDDIDISTMNFKGRLWSDGIYSTYLGFPFDAYDVNYWLPPADYGTGYPVDVHLASESYVDSAISRIDFPEVDLSDIDQAIADLRTESALVYRLYSGSNVVCEVTNYNSQVHAPTMRLMQLNENNEYITVWTETNGLTRTLSAANRYTDDATNALPATFAPRAWSRTTSGLGADAPSNTTWISTPRTVIAGGFEYAKVVDTYGEVWVLSSNGMGMDFDPDTNAYFRITADDGTPVFSIEKSDSQVLGADSGSITVSENSVVLTVPVVSKEAPTMYWRQFLNSGDWADQSSPPTGATVTWSGTTGAWVCTVSFAGTRPSSIFFRFSFIQEGGVTIRNNATTDISAGVYVNGVKFVPSVSGNNLIWTKQ